MKKKFPQIRSLLFVPGDSERKYRKALESGADALILDLEDAVAHTQKAKARAEVSAWIHAASGDGPLLIVRINALDSGLAVEDLAAIVRPGLDAILLPKSNGAGDIGRVGYYLEALETRIGWSEANIGILAVATETPTAMFAFGSYVPSHPRLLGLTWGAEDLSAAIGAFSNKAEDGAWTFPYQLARAQCLFASAAADVVAIDTLYSNFRDVSGLARDCTISRRDGFTGRIAIHPDQVPVINDCYSPSQDEIAHARRIVRAFEEQPDAGALSIDGHMYDIPHLKAAKRILLDAGHTQMP